ncbi:MAG: response regulator [Bacteriovoracaceae bacterium]
MPTPFKVYLLDDHKIIRDGIRSILKSNENFQVIGENGDPEKFLNEVERIPMDILVLDISFPGVSGLHILKKVKMMRPDLKVLVLSMHNDPEYMKKALSLGANGYLAKDCDSNELLRFLENIMAGKMECSEPASPSVGKIATPDLLTGRELEILKLLSGGLSSKEIASQLSISTRTVETHRLNIMKKLRTSNSAETISVAVRMHLL